MLTQLGLFALAILPASGTRRTVHPPYRPKVEVWTNRGDAAVYARGDGVRIYVQTDQDAYVTLFRVDTDGRVRVIFPREPWEDNYVRGGREFEVEGRSAHDAFYVDDYPGMGYVFAVAAADPFVYDPISSGDHWDYRVIADGRVRGDPYVALTDLAQRIVPDGYADWDYDVVSYSVERHYDYPRFLCYDCHAYASWPYWDPYAYSCVRFRIVVYDDPWYYPYRYYGGTRVVFVRPFRPEPRFIFRTWGGTPSREQFVTRERSRPENDNTRRGVRARDMGGVGAIPAPRERGQVGRQRDDTPQGPPARGDDRGTRRRPDSYTPGDRSGGGVRQGDRGGLRDGQARPTRIEPVPEREQRGSSRNEPREERRVEPRGEPRSQPRAEPRNEPQRPLGRRDPPARAEPRNEPREQRRAEPRNEPRNPPRAEPRKEPRRESPPARGQPELRRRKP